MARPDTLTSALAVTENLSDGDLTILVVGDSTGDTTTEWPYLLAVRFGMRYDATVSYRTWDATGNAWSSATTAWTGAGHALDFRNASVGGWDSTDALADLDALATGITPDLVIVNLGHNDSSTEATFTTDYQALLDAITAEWPAAVVVCTLQNASRADANQTMRRTVIQTIAAAEGMGTVDIYAEFGSDTPDANLYDDNVHPGTTGSLRWAGRLAVDLLTSDRENDAA